ncbi:hypothetical protein O6H91_17G049200 [Diphasiastrum complanatum]|uniref:Uncharacterized protein n=1 Tax=Diphasiastrum complanatum TaxID=34168 RepID=A0ACC2B6L9_DIPCM|nr:hypothetical protein O6H91_17G049200 [Diphasiastrum complanatum]
MACEPHFFNILGKDVFQDGIILEALGGSEKNSEGMSRRFQSSGMFAKHQNVLSHAENVEGYLMNLSKQPPGFLEMWRFGCIALAQYPFVEVSLLDLLQGANMLGGGEWDAKDVYSAAHVSSGIFEDFPMIGGFAELSLLDRQELESKVRDNSIFVPEKMFLSTVGWQKDYGEDDAYMLPLLERKLHLSRPKEQMYKPVIESDQYNVPIQFRLSGDNESVFNPYSQFSLAMDMFTIGNGNDSNATENSSTADVQCNIVSNLEDFVQESYECHSAEQKESCLCGSLQTSSIGVNGIFRSFGRGSFDKGSQNSRMAQEGMKISWFQGRLVGEENRGDIILDQVNKDCYCHMDDPSGFSAGGTPEGFTFVLPYLQLQDLLAMEQVSKSLRDSVRNDTSLWTNLCVDHPLSKKVTDDVLARLSARARGHLQSLSLLKCSRITDAGVQQVLVTNPMILKLWLPGCTGVSAEGVVKMVKAHTEGKSIGMPGLKQLRIRGLAGVTTEHVEKLQAMLYGGDQVKPGTAKPQYYHYGNYSSFCDDDRVIDVETCPKCGNARMVYDCTRERCQQNLQQCRGCTFCISRCEECGTCIDETEYEETFCLDLLCSSCWLRPPKCLQCNRPEGGLQAEHFAGGPDTFFICSDCDGISPEEPSPKFYVT